MGTRTKAQARGAQASRTYDHLYDPVYTSSSAQDHARAEMTAAFDPNAARVVRVPDNSNMFSDLVHKPNATVTLKAGDPVPAGIARDFHQLSRQSAAQKAAAQASADPTGRDLHKYVGRPRVPHLDPHAATGTWKTLRLQRPPRTADRRVRVAKTRTLAVQTDYRESETQTDPYTPEHVVRPGSAPEVLTLATLSYGHGLPAGLAEVEMIERARAKREWEKTVPAASDLARSAQRQKMLEEQELREWKEREREIEAIQEERMRVLKDHMLKREENRSLRVNDRLDKLWEQRQQEHEKRVRRLEREATTALRKLGKQRRSVEPTVERRDVVADYGNASSDVFAPRATLRPFSIDHVQQQPVQSQHISTYHGLLDLEASLPQKLTQPRIAPPKARKASGKAARTKQRLQDTLRSLDETARMTRRHGLPVQPPPKYLEKVAPPPKRPPTPDVDAAEEEEGDEEREVAAIMLQQLIRGRAAQNQLFEEKEMRRELIDEVRSTHALQEAEMQLKEQERQELEKHRAAQAAAEHKKQTARQTLGDVQAAAVGDTLDFLSKELVRLQEERRIHAFAMLAERQRRMREAAEAGRRQAEEKRRAERDEIFRQVVAVHQATIDTYLEDLILDAQHQVADEQARVAVREQARTVNEIAQELHDQGVDQTELGAQTIAADLMYSFLLPEAEKQAARQGVQRAQRRHITAAHQTVFPEVQGAEQELARERASRRQSAQSRLGSAGSVAPTSRLGSAKPALDALPDDDQASSA